MRVLAHAHSRYSYDGHLSLSDLASACRRMRVDAVLMSEHDRGMDGARFEQFAADCSRIEAPMLIPGVEFTWFGNHHVLAYGLQRWPVTGNLEAWASDVRDQGALLVMAHPGKYDWRIPADLMRLVDGVEIWNSKWPYDGWLAPNNRSIALAGSRLAFCGQDVHRKRHLSPLVLVMPDRSSAREILASLRAGDYRISNGVFTLPSRGPRLLRWRRAWHRVRLLLVAGKQASLSTLRWFLSMLPRRRHSPEPSLPIRGED